MNDKPPMIPLEAGEQVYVPSGRIAEVLGAVGERVLCRYTDDREEVVLLPHLLRRVGTAAGRGGDTYG